MTNDELRKMAEAALTDDDWGYAYDDYTDAATPQRVIALLDENAALRAALEKIEYGDHLSDYCRSVASAALEGAK